MSPHRFIALTVAVLLTTACGQPDPETGAQHPTDSTLLITIDTIRPDHVTAYGAAEARTPTLDRLAAEGVLFEHAYAVAPLTLPAHASLLTGAYPPEHGVRNNGIHALADSWTTLPEWLAGEGVRTAAVVAATVLDRRYGLAQGFEAYDDEMRADRTSAAAVDRPAAAVTAAARRWLDGVEDDERFFLWVHYFDPHAPYAPPEEFRQVGEPYDGEIAYVDAEIGRLLEHRRLAADDGLAVIVVGDHGESLGEHGELTHGMLAYDSTLHVPWIVRPPTRTGSAGGERRADRVDQVDLLPTVLAAMGVEAPAEGRGRDLFALEEGAAPRPLYAETWAPFYTYGWAKLSSLRLGPDKLIEAPTPELYDLAADPDESENLVAEERRTAAELRRRLEGMFPAGGRAAAVEADRETRSQLRALGYLGNLGGAGREAGDPKELMAVHVAVEEANRRLLDGDPAAAIEGYRRALERDPTNLRALSDLATAQATSGRLAEGIATLERALRLAPENAQLHLQRAAFAEEQGDAETALAHLDLALDLAPALLEARLEKAAYLARLGRAEAAAAAIRETVERHPEDAEANALHAQLVEIPAGDVEGAERRLRRALERDPYLDSARRALAELEGASPPAPPRPATGDAAARTREAVDAYRRGDRTGAVEILEAVVADRPGYAPGWVNLSWIALESEAWETAARHARRALDLDPTLGRAWVNLGQAREAQGRRGEAETAYRSAVEADGEDWQARLRLALVLLQGGRQEEGLRELGKVEEVAAEVAEARFQLGRVYEVGGDLGRARVNYEAVVRLAPGGELAAVARERLEGL